VPAPSSRQIANSLIAQGAVERVTRCLVQGVADSTSATHASTLLGSCLGAGSPVETAAFAENLCNRLIALHDSCDFLRQRALQAGVGDEIDSVVNTVSKAVVSAVGALTREQCRIDCVSSGEVETADSNTRADSPVNGNDHDFDADSGLFVAGASSVQPNREEPAVGGSAAHAAPLSAVCEYAEHRMAVASWTTQHAHRQLESYAAERSRDDEIRATIDTERSHLELLAARSDRRLTELQSTRLEQVAERLWRNEEAQFERDSFDIAIKHERGLQRTIDKEIKTLQSRIDTLRASKASSENKVTALSRKLENAQGCDPATADLEASIRAVDASLCEQSLRRWAAALGARLIDDVESEAALLNSNSLQARERKLGLLISASTAAVKQALDAQSCLVSRLAHGRAQLSDLLIMSPTSSSTLTESDAAVSHFPPATPPGQHGVTSSFTSARGDSFGTSSTSHQDIAVCGNDILIVMTRVAAAAEDLHNRLRTLISAATSAEISLEPCKLEEIDAVFRTLADTIDGTRGDTLDAAFCEVSSTPAMRRPVSAEELTDEHGRKVSTLGTSVGGGKRGLPKKLARARTTVSQLGSVDVRSGAGGGPVRPPSTTSLDIQHRTVDSGARQTWVSFIAQFRTVFGAPA